MDHALRMDELFTLHPNGLFLRGEALDFGYRDRDLAEARRAGVIARVRHGAYVSAGSWETRDEVGRYQLRGQAVCLTHDNRVALSHTSGAAEHGLRLWKPDLQNVHVTRLDRSSGRHQAGVVYHEDGWHPDDVYAKQELLLLGPETCALGSASLTTTTAGVVILDSVLDLGLGSPDSLSAAYARRERWPFSNKLQMTMRLTRAGAQSIGESLCRDVMWKQHLPEPRLQFKVYDERGELVGITDFAWPDHGLLGEFDGMIKYGRLLKPGETPGEAVEREKKREDRLREITGWRMIRYVWENLFQPETTAARTRRMLNMAKAA
jgi:hypothetical protein